MIKKVTYYSIIILFITIFCILPNLIADSSAMGRSFICYLLIILIIGYNLIKYKHHIAQTIYKCKALTYVNILWIYLLIYNLLFLLNGSSGIVHYLLSFTTWVVCANLFYILGYLKEKDKSNDRKQLTIERIIKILTICIICYLFINQLRLFLTIGWLSEFATTFGMEGDVQLFKNIIPFLLASLSLGLFFLKKQALIVSCLILMIIGILLASKRGPIVGICVSFFIMTLFQQGYTKKIKIFIISILIAYIGYVIILQISPELINDFVLRFTSEDEVGSGRLVVWNEGFKKWNNWQGLNVLFGGGPGFSSVLMQKTQWGIGVNSHSDYFDILFQYGYTGSILQLLYCWQIVKSLFDARKQSNFKYKNLLLYSGAFILITQAYTMTYIYIVAIISSIFYFYALGKLQFYKSQQYSLKNSKQCTPH